MLNQIAPEVTVSLVLLLFAEGVFAFLSPCILPMLPVYLMYLAGEGDQQDNQRRLIINTLGFIAGFTIIFILLGVTASGLGTLMREHRQLMTQISGVIILLFGLNFIGIINIPFLNQTRTLEANKKDLTFLTSIVFGGAFSFGWTPCLGPFLGSALLLASSSATLWAGVGLLAVFSMGLGIPFLLTALLWNKLQGTMRFIKKHLNKIRMVSGGLLILVGLSMLFGWFDYYLRLFS